MATLTALAAAFFFGSAHILVRYGLRTGSTTTAITFNIATMGTVLLAVMGPWADWSQASRPAVGWFMLAGAVAPLTTQFLFYAAISRVGVARASPLRNTSPLFAGIVAVAWLGEQWTPALLSGTVLIILGATVLGLRDARALTAFRKRDLLFALGASVLGGAASPIRKFGYSMLTSVPLAICLTLMGSLCGLILYLVVWRGYRDVMVNRGTGAVVRALGRRHELRHHLLHAVAEHGRRGAGGSADRHHAAVLGDLHPSPAQGPRTGHVQGGPGRIAGMRRRRGADGVLTFALPGPRSPVDNTRDGR